MFKDNLKQLRNSHKVSQIKLAKAINITDRTCRKYESGEIEPTLSVLIKLADYFNVSLDYLVGRSDNPRRY